MFQINSIHRGNSWYPSNPSDPLQSAKAAYALWKGAGGRYTDWTVYNSGKYREYLGKMSGVYPNQGALQPYVANTGASGGLRNAIVSKAQVYIGLPYIWGGTNLSKGVDCSGLVYAIYNSMGIKVPRLTAQGFTQGFTGKGVAGITGYKTSVANLQPGDLVSWYGGAERGVQIGHIAIYAGNGEII